MGTPVNELTGRTVAESMSLDELRNEYEQAWTLLDELGAPRTNYIHDPRGTVRVGLSGTDSLLTLRGRIRRIP